MHVMPMQTDGGGSHWTEAGHSGGLTVSHSSSGFRCLGEHIDPLSSPASRHRSSSSPYK